MEINAIFNNISVILWQTLSHNVHLTMSGIQTHNFSGDRCHEKGINFHATGRNELTSIFMDPLTFSHCFFFSRIIAVINEHASWHELITVAVQLQVYHYMIKFVSDLRYVGGFLWILWFPPTIKPTAMI